MTFAKEEISDEDSSAVNWSVFVDYDNQWNIPPTHWVIDRSRNFFFWSIRKQMPGLPREKFGLWLEREVVYVQAFKSYLEIFVDGRKLEVCCWDEVGLVFSKNSERCMEDVKDIVREALEAYGDGTQRLGLPTARVTFR